MKALVLAAGLGSRLRPITNIIPKPLLPIRGVPLLAIHLEQLRNAGVSEVFVNAHHLSDQVLNFIDGYMISRPDMHIVVSTEIVLLGSAGTLAAARDFFSDENDFFVVYGDNLTNIDFSALSTCHRTLGTVVTIAANIVADEDVPSKGIVECDSGTHVSRFLEKPSVEETDSRLSNAGVYCCSPRIFDFLEDGHGLPYDFGQHLFPHMLGRNAPLGVYRMFERLLDVGTPTSFGLAQLETWVDRYHQGGTL